MATERVDQARAQPPKMRLHDKRVRDSAAERAPPGKLRGISNRFHPLIVSDPHNR